MRTGFAIVALACLLMVAAPVSAGHDSAESTSTGDTTPAVARPTGEEKSVAQTFIKGGVIAAVVVGGIGFFWYRQKNKAQRPTLARGEQDQDMDKLALG